MKLNRVLLLIMVFVIAAAGTAFANSALEYLRAKKMEVAVNGETVAASGYLAQINRKDVAMADVQSLLKTFGGYMRIDEKTGKIEIFKPNVQLTVNVKESGRSNKYIHTHTFEVNRVYDIRISATVDGVLEDMEALQFTILDPSGKELVSQTVVGSVVNDNNITQLNLDINKWLIEKPGLYTANFSIKPVGEDQFYRVGQTKFEYIE